MGREHDEKAPVTVSFTDTDSVDAVAAFKMIVGGLEIIKVVGIGAEEKLQLLHTLELQIMRLRHNVTLGAVRK